MDKVAPTTSADEAVVYDQPGPYWTHENDGEAKLFSAKSGYGSHAQLPPSTLVAAFEKAVKQWGQRPAMAIEEGVDLVDGKAPPALPFNKWKKWTYRQYFQECQCVAKSFIELGMQPHDAINIFGFNSPQWFMSQMGGILAQGAAAGIYPSDTADQVAFKSHHSNGSIACVETEKNLETFASVVDRLPYLKAVVIWAGNAGEDIKRSDGSVVKTMTWEELVKMGKELENDAALDERMRSQKPGDCCSLIYTSGTTGNPKAVMISHDNLIFESRCVLEGCLGDIMGGKAEQERLLSYLPLSHVAGMMFDIVSPIVSTAYQKGWITVAFARAYDLKTGTIKDRLNAVNPTLFLGVPRVWEKIAEKMKALGASTKGLKKKIATFAKRKGLNYEAQHQLGGSGGGGGFGYNVANKIVLSKIKAALGLSQCKFAFAGAAPMTKDTLEYYGQLGINVNEVYGMSECTGAVTWSTDKHHLWGSVGYEMPGMQVKIFKVAADDINSKTECPLAVDINHAKDSEQGEICFRGRNIMMGYMANPKLGEEHVATIKKKNADAIDEEGWLHSGDMGCKGVNGMVKITGRFKELIIGAGGENIAPVPIEDNMKRICPGISNIMMVGDKRKFNVCLITLKCEGATGELPGTEILEGAAAGVSSAKTVTEAMADPVWEKTITDALTATNKNGECCPSNASRIQKYTILPRDFSVETGELTATLKLKRSVVDKKHSDLIEKMYASSETFVPFN